MKIVPLVLFLLSGSVSAGEFQLRYTDSAGLRWSQALPVATNGCLDADGIYQRSRCTFEKNADGSPVLIGGLKQVRAADSKAAQACANIGGRLPILQEYVALVKDFDWVQGGYPEPTGWPKLTQKGWRDIKDTFGDMVDHLGFGDCFWSSSLLKNRDEIAYVFDTTEFGVGVYLERKFASCQVRCVANP